MLQHVLRSCSLKSNRAKNQPAKRRSSQQPRQAAVFSYYQSRSTPESSRGRYEPPATHARGLNRLKHIPTALALVVIFLCVGYASMLSATPRVIVTATESGKGLQQPDTVYASFMETAFRQSLMNRSKLSFNGLPAVEALRQKYPEVSNAIVTVPLIGHRPVVRIAVSSPAFVLSSTSGSFYVSDKGIPLVSVKDVEKPLTDIVTIADESNIPISVGKQVLPQDTVAYIQTLLQQLQTTNTAFDTITLPLAANEVQVQLTGKPYYVRFNTLEDPQVQVGTLRAVQNRFEKTGETPQTYIDLRVAERAYYK